MRGFGNTKSYKNEPTKETQARRNHPLRETLMGQTGKTEELRIRFLRSVLDDSTVRALSLDPWKPKEEGKAAF